MLHIVLRGFIVIMFVLAFIIMGFFYTISGIIKIFASLRYRDKSLLSSGRGVVTVVLNV